MGKKHTVMGNIWFLIKQSYALDRSMLLSAAARVPIRILIPLLGSYLTKYMTSLVPGQTREAALLWYILSYSGALLLLNLADNYVAARLKYDAMFVRLGHLGRIADKDMDADFQNVEDPEGQLLAQKAKEAVWSDRSGVEQLFGQMVDIFSAVFGLAVYSALLFGFMPWAVALLLVLGVADFLVGQRFSRWQYRNRGRWAEHDRHLGYLNSRAGDCRAAKDIRLFGLAPWLETLYREFLGDRMHWYRKEEGKRLGTNWACLLLAFLRDGLAYGMLIYRLFAGRMEISGFIFYFTIMTQYSVWISAMMNGLVAIKTSSYTAEDIRQFLEMPDCFNHGEGAPLPAGTCEIRFRHVGFRYPGAGQDTIGDLDFTIGKGEKVAIVGTNGAGKTTLVKLLCGLYAPTRGSILVDGTDIRDYNIDEYFGLYSVVFQDIYLMPTTIARNIALAEEGRIDRLRLERALALSGLAEKVESLPEKENTLLLKGIQEKGIELSGGERQKLALARALYKDGGIVVLDEPTAALDPIAESGIYQKYSELTAGRTAIFISHRLASTRFCDSILVLEEGRIVERGSHEQLMALDGKYAAMFRVQSRYYGREGTAERI
ncbi:MAG: ABC transporter ATP-binding protein [Lachnospiraceae bacterium]|nr:ABC transporter ATP-binding protein [uncultured Acetatifactor sp.]MCI9573463.1 ABC transporter ATP-binding protein [Lachnospiraceae bacterium]